MMNIRMLACMAVFLLTGCAGKSYVVLLDDPDGSTGKIVVKGSQGEQTIDQSGQGALLDGSKPPETIDKAQIARDFGAAMAARPAPPQHFLLYFETSGAEPTQESIAELDKIIEAASRRPAVDVSVIGHTDTSGDAGANEALGLKRARIVADLLKQKGLKTNALFIESHGESDLLVKTPDGTVEPRNRRVEVSIR